jgi:hypothetical protein
MRNPGIIGAQAHPTYVSREPRRLAGEEPRLAALPDYYKKGRITVKKLLSLAIIAGLLGLTTGCPNEPTGKKADTSKKADGPKKDEPKKDKDEGKKDEPKKDEGKKPEKTEPKKDEGKKDEGKKDEKK